MNRTRSKEEIFRELAGENDGIMTTAMIEKAGISRVEIPGFIKSGLLRRESRGIYALASRQTDTYGVLASRSDKIVFSYETSLYLMGISNKAPGKVSVTVPQGYNVSRIKKDFPNVDFHYVKTDLWGVGITRVRTPQGTTVQNYDTERSICDLVRNHEKTGKGVYRHAMRQYFGRNMNEEKLLNMARTFHIEDRIRTYMEVL